MNFGGGTLLRTPAVPARDGYTLNPMIRSARSTILNRVRPGIFQVLNNQKTKKQTAYGPELANFNAD
jgi:hypothetical protein